MDYTNNDVLTVKKGDVYYLQFKILNKFKDKLNHAITLRHGGVSEPPIESLSFKFDNENRNASLKNLDIICKEASFDKDNIYKAKQNHTDNILILNDYNKSSFSIYDVTDEEYDGYITDKKNIATLVTTADCNPIIMYDCNKNIVANIHSGWKGTIKKIYLKAINIFLENFNSNIEDIIVCIGPSIRKCCFSSEEESFKEKFTSIWKDEDKYIYYEDNNKRFHIDLPYIIIQDLISSGIKEKNIFDAKICTMCNNNDFFSYRFSKKQNYKNYGLMATIVELI